MRRTFPILLVVAAGCGGPEYGTVGGEVRVGGKLLEKGSIAFAPADGAGDTAEAAVRDGRYEIRTLVGRKKVLVSAPKVTGRHKAYDGPDAPLVDVVGERLPERYHSKTELEYEVKPGTHTKDWDLQEK